MSYEIVEVLRYIIVGPNGYQADHTQTYQTRERAQRDVDALLRKDAEREAKLARDEAARASKQKWTPETLRAYLAADPHWEIDDSEGDPNFVGVHKAVWRELDSKQPFSVNSAGRRVVNFELYGPVYIVWINDNTNNSRGAQFALRDTSIESGLEYEYATVDRLAKALIRRGLMEPPKGKTQQ